MPKLLKKQFRRPEPVCAAILILLAAGCATRLGVTHLKPAGWSDRKALMGVRTLTPDGLGQAAGLRRGDWVIAADDLPVASQSALDEIVRSGDGPVELDVVRGGVEWHFSISDQVRDEGLGIRLAPAYRVLSEHDPPAVVAEGNGFAVTGWVKVTGEMTVVDVTVENLSDEPLEVIPPAFQLLDESRYEVSPYHPGDLADSYLERAERSLEKARLLGGGNRVLSSANLFNPDPVSAALTTVMAALPAHAALRGMKKAREANERAETILHRAYRFGFIAARSSQEGLLFYPRLEEFPVMLVVHLRGESLALAFDGS